MDEMIMAPTLPTWFDNVEQLTITYDQLPIVNKYLQLTSLQ